MTVTPVQKILKRLDETTHYQPTRSGNGWSARCPAHEDQHPSLSIGVGDDGRVLLKCHTGCSLEDIVAAMNLTKSDLFPAKPNSTKAQIVGRYDYGDASGKLRYQVVRYAPKRFRMRRPSETGGWIWNVKNVTRLLYRLPELEAAPVETPVFVCEGEKDADRLAALGLVATTNSGGASKWSREYTQSLHGRYVVLMQDNDSAGKKRVKSIAQSMYGCAARVKIVTLPDLPAHGDVSDWLDSGGTLEQLLAIVDATPESKPNATKTKNHKAPQYRLTEEGLVWEKPVGEGYISVPLTNFCARILEDRIEDDGVEQQRTFCILASMGSEQRTFEVVANQFASMNWVVANLGSGAIIYPSYGVKEHSRTAIQVLSSAVRKTVYTHLGWRKRGGQWIYLHAGGAIGTNGPVTDVEVGVSGDLQRYVLPNPPTNEELVSSVRASLRLLEVAPAQVTLPLLASVFRAPLGTCDYSLALAGPTGAGKTEIAALAQQHYGPGLDSRHLPANWSSTANALEGIAFSAKDGILVVDDFAPTGSIYDVHRLHREADRLLRAQGNASGRQRMRADASLRPTKPPRGLIITTGEDVPRGQSLRARIAIIEIGPTDVDWKKLTHCQRDAATGCYATTMAGYIQWLAGRYDELRATLRQEINSIRARVTSSGQHRRTADIVANLAMGFRRFLTFAESVGTITSDEVNALHDKAWDAFVKLSAHQAQHQHTSEPTTRFIELMGAIISSGAAHIASTDGTEPRENPKSWGWRERTIGSGNSERSEWQPQGACVGWLDGDELYLEPDASFAAVQRIAHDGGESLAVGRRTLHKRLDERGLLVSHENGRLTVRRLLQGKKRPVLHLRASLLGEKTCPTCPSCSLPADAEDQCTFSGHGFSGTDEKRAPEICPETREKRSLGTEGTEGTFSPPNKGRNDDSDESKRTECGEWTA